MDIQKFKSKPIMGIVRGVEPEGISSLIETSMSAGLETLEITMNTPGAAGMIRDAVNVSRGRVAIGAGTVLSVESMKQALDSGATFIVMPVLIEDIVNYCLKHKIPVFPGALTPQEVFNAWNAGATMVKIFPSGFFGPRYLKEIKGPFNEIELMGCGGVTPGNIKDYFANGASAVAIGGSVFRKEWLAAKDFSSIGNTIKSLVDAYNNASAT
ncbi:bifunctional 4-hydroxy-2-oxoglutarate aldolase/2-dehydro-3-deoxy-phosphogluconate aldolase [Candidatus Auribacterota bacterium]